MDHITIQHCLLPIHTEQLTYFKLLYKKWQEELPPLDVQIHNKTDALAAILNSWAFSIAQNTWSMFSPEKSISHQSNFYILDLLGHSHQLTQILNEYRDDDDKLFVLSYYLGLHCMRWVDFVLKHENPVLAENIFAMNSARSYYLLTELDVVERQDQELYVQQKVVTYLLVQDQQQRNRFDSLVEKSYNQTEYIVETKRKGLHHK